MTVKGWLYIFIVVLILGLCCAVLWLWKEKDNAAAKLLAEQRAVVVLTDQTKADAKTIASLTSYNDQNSKVIATFTRQVADISGKFSTLDRNIQNLRRNNPDVERYLATPIPPALLCVLGGMCNEAVAAKPAQ